MRWRQLDPEDPVESVCWQRPVEVADPVKLRESFHCFFQHGNSKGSCSGHNDQAIQ